MENVLNPEPSFPSNVKAAVTFSVDDCWENTSLIMLELFEELDICGTFNVIAGFSGKKIGHIKFADWRLLREIAMHGNELASHSLTHKPLNASMMPRLRKIADAARYEDPVRLSWRIISLLKQKPVITNVEHLSFKEELHLSREIIQKKTGTSCKTYVYPGGNYDERYKHMVMKVGYTSARSGHIGYNSARNMDIFALKVQVWDSKVDEKTARLWVNKALSNNYWLIEVIHAVNYPDYIYSANPRDLRSHIEYVADKRDDLWVSTQSKIADFLK